MAADFDVSKMSTEELAAMYSEMTGKKLTVTNKKKLKPIVERVPIRTMVRSGMNPVTAGLAATAQEAAPAAYQYLNNIVGGLGTPALREHGYAPPEPPQTMPGKILEGMGAVGGFMAGAPMKVGTKLAGKIPGVGLAPEIMRGSTQLGTAGFLQTPINNMVTDIKSRTIAGASGVIAGIVTGSITRGLQNLKTLGEKSAPELAQKTRGVYEKYVSDTTKSYGEGLEKIAEANKDNSVSLVKEVNAFRKTVDSSRKVKNFIARLSDTSKRVLKDIGLGKKIGVKESEALISDVQSTMSSAQKAGNVQPNEIAIVRFVKSLKNAQENAFDGMRALRKAYENRIKAINEVDRFMKVGKTLQGAKNMWGDQEVQAMVKQTIGKALYKDLAGYSAATAFSKWVPSVLQGGARIAAIGGGLGYGLSRLKRGNE